MGDASLILMWLLLITCYSICHTYIHVNLTQHVLFCTAPCPQYFRPVV